MLLQPFSFCHHPITIRIGILSTYGPNDRRIKYYILVAVISKKNKFFSADPLLEQRVSTTHAITTVIKINIIINRFISQSTIRCLLMQQIDQEEGNKYISRWMHQARCRIPCSSAGILMSVSVSFLRDEAPIYFFVLIER